MDFREQLAKLGLSRVTYKYNLSKNQLFYESIAHDRGRVRIGGGYEEQKSFATKLGDQGPLVYYTDPTCTGRPVNDTFAVAWPEVESRIWWKDNLKPIDPDKYQSLLARVIKHVNAVAISMVCDVPSLRCVSQQWVTERGNFGTHVCSGGLAAGL